MTFYLILDVLKSKYLVKRILDTCILAMGVRGESRISWKGLRKYKGMGVRFADFISFVLKYPMKMK